MEKRKNPVCGFVTPLEGSEADAHRKPEVSDLHSRGGVLMFVLHTDEAGDVYDLMLGISASCQQAIVLEGSYWKRRIEVVIKEYHKWRIFYKKRVSARFFYRTFADFSSEASRQADICGSE